MTRQISGIAAAVLWMGTCVPAFAQAPPIPQVPPDRRAPQTVPATPTAPPTTDLHAGQNHRVKDILGTRITIQGGLAVGTVEDMVFDDEGSIEYLVVRNDGKYVVVPWQAAKFNFGERTAAVEISQQQFQQVPSFSIQAWPVFDAAYRQRIYHYYNLPGRDRRIERREDRRGP